MNTNIITLPILNWLGTDLNMIEAFYRYPIHFVIAESQENEEYYSKYRNAKIYKSDNVKIIW